MKDLASSIRPSDRAATSPPVLRIPGGPAFIKLKHRSGPTCNKRITLLGLDKVHEINFAENIYFFLISSYDMRIYPIMH